MERCDFIDSLSSLWSGRGTSSASVSCSQFCSLLLVETGLLKFQKSIFLKMVIPKSRDALCKVLCKLVTWFGKSSMYFSFLLQSSSRRRTKNLNQLSILVYLVLGSGEEDF